MSALSQEAWVSPTENAIKGDAKIRDEPDSKPEREITPKTGSYRKRPERGAVLQDPGVIDQFATFPHETTLLAQRANPRLNEGSLGQLIAHPPVVFIGEMKK